MKFNKICILGLGYIGLPTASMFATHGIKVIGVDINQSIIETLQAGRIHIHEPGLGEAVEKAVKSGNLSIAAQPEPADAFLIAVPTPFYEHDFGRYDGQTYKKADKIGRASCRERV
jgi:UDP-N-acetyl-D-mannosaminuronic acid dehydrogenase